MHTNYYFLRQLAPALAPKLTGLTFMECFSQDRDEVVLVFAHARGKINYYRPFYIKASLRPDFSGLYFPETVQRARHNSVDLFQALYDKNVIGVRHFLNERCLAIILEGEYTLLFKFFGNRPNLLAFQGNEVIDLFNHKLTSDEQLHLDHLDRPIDQSFAAFEQAGYDHRKLFPTFGKLVNRFLEEKKTQEDEDGTTKWERLQSVLHALDQPHYSLIWFDHHPALSLLPPGEPAGVSIIREFTDPLEAANQFYTNYNGLSLVEHEKADTLRLIDKRLKRLQSQIDANLQRLIAREEGPSHEEIGNILMANLHQIAMLPGGRSPERVALQDFYRDQAISIKLKTDLSPQRNAESYYRKAKNEKIEEDHLTLQITDRETEIAQLHLHRAAIERMESLKVLRKYLKQHSLLSTTATTDPTELFKQVDVEGFRILIGRNAKNNDLLTQRYSFKDDLWLHARDVSGSHVLVKYQAGKTFPKSVIERAAELAAWYSKRRTDTLCPVIVTPKKYVRKPKGLAEGQVVVEKEDVVMVVPRA